MRNSAVMPLYQKSKHPESCVVQNSLFFNKYIVILDKRQDFRDEITTETKCSVKKSFYTKDYSRNY